MRRYLLFDSGCSQCMEIAQAVEQAAQGWLEARSLRDPAMQRLLDAARPGWRWEPTLLEVTEGHVRAFTGLALALRLVWGLGPRRALRLAQQVGRLSRPAPHPGPVDLGRRLFLKQLAAVALVLGFPKSRTFGQRPSKGEALRAEGAPLASPALADGEIYEGFLLLPAWAPVPPFVRCAPAPILCQTDGEPDPALIGRVVELRTLEEVKRHVSFPLYLPRALPPGMQFLQALLFQFARSGDLFQVMLHFGFPPGEPLISVWAQPVYPQPYPVWPVWSPDAPEVPIPPEKVTFTPSPGVMRPTFSGHMIQWIRHGVLYTLVVEHSPQREAAIAIAQSLSPM